MKTTNSKTAESKAKFGTLTALEDSNNDYGATSQSSTTASVSQHGTMTATQDANGDYSASTVSSSYQNSKANSKKQNSMTAQYDANQKP